MGRLALSAALLSALIAPRPLRAAVTLQSGPALAAAEQASLEGEAALETSALEAARTAAGKTMDGASTFSADPTVEAQDGQGLRHGLAGSPMRLATAGGGPVPPPNRGQGAKGRKKIPTWAVYGGAAVLGGLQGFLSAGLAGALGGVVLGLGAAYLYEKGDFGAAFGMTAGGIIGSFLGGPLGALIGGAVGGLIGHFLGKLFG